MRTAKARKGRSNPDGLISSKLIHYVFAEVSNVGVEAFVLFIRSGSYCDVTRAGKTPRFTTSKDIATAIRYSRFDLDGCGQTNLAQLSNGDVVAAVHRHNEGSPTGDVLLVRSCTGGARWGGAGMIFDGGGTMPGYGPATMVQLATGELLCCAAKFQFLFESGPSWKRGSEIEGLYLRKSFDQGRSWGVASRIDIRPFQTAWPHGSILELPGGRLLLPLSGQRSDRYRRLTEPVTSFLLRSDDRGASWCFHALVAADGGIRDYDEPSIVRGAGGRLTAFLKTSYPQSNEVGGHFWQSTSDDGGLRWQTPVRTQIWGDSAQLTQLSDGRLLCTFSYPIHPGPGIRRCISQDGMLWRAEEIADVVREPDGAGLGCPHSIQLANGSVLTAYCAAGGNNHAAATETPAKPPGLESACYYV